MSYLRSIHFQKDKSVFKLEELPLERYAESLGLPGAPKVKFLSKEIAKRKKNASHIAVEAQIDKPESSDESDSDDEGELSEHSSSEEEETVISKAEPDKVRDQGRFRPNQHSYACRL